MLRFVENLRYIFFFRIYSTVFPMMSQEAFAINLELLTGYKLLF